METAYPISRFSFQQHSCIVPLLQTMLPLSADNDAERYRLRRSISEHYALRTRRPAVSRAKNQKMNMKIVIATAVP